MSLDEIVNHQMDSGNWTKRYVEGVDAKDISSGTARSGNMMWASMDAGWLQCGRYNIGQIPQLVIRTKSWLKGLWRSISKIIIRRK